MSERLGTDATSSESWANVLEDLSGLDPERVSRLVSCCATVATTDGKETSIPADAVLVVVEAGIVLLVAVDAAGTAILAFARRGDLLIPPVEREALVGLGPGLLRIIDAHTLTELLAIDGAGFRLVERLGAVVRDRQESLRLLAVNPQRERVRQKLLQLARLHGRVRSDGVRIALPLTHELLARAVGSARETVTVAMRELRHEGFVTRNGRSYVLRIRPRELEPRLRGSPAAAPAASRR